MTEANFDVVFSGRVQSGLEATQVRDNLARLFKTEPERLAYLFTGQRVPIKRGVDAGTALQYQAALAKAGALVELVEVTAEAAPANAAAPPPPPPARAATRAAPVTVPPAIAARDGPPAAPAFSLAEPGAVLVAPTEVPTPTIATDHLTLAAPGATLVEPTTVAAPEYDLSGLCLAPPGAPLSAPEAPPTAQYDLSKLSLVPPD